MTVLTLCATAISVFAQNSSNRSATPVDPIDAILKAFESYSIVALGEGPHGNEQGRAFRLQLIRDRRFAATVNDIVDESGAGYQDVVDRYLHGEDVPTNTMRVTRMVLSGMPANVPDRLNSECAAARR